MGETSIEWTRGADGSKGFSWNALRAQRTIMRKGKPFTASAHHCEHVNEACRFCYADRQNARLGGLPFKPGHRKDYTFVIDEKKLLAPLRMRKPRRIFVMSMGDAFGDWWPPHFVHKLYAVMALTPHHTYINLTKRPERRRAFLADPKLRDIISEEMWALSDQRTDHINGGLPLQHVIEGVSVSCQPEADEFLPILLRTNAAKRAVSCEPLLGAIDLAQHLHDSDCGAPKGSICTCRDPREVSLDWVIAGGESGTRARPMHPAWPRSLHDQCALADVPFFFKQWGEWHPCEVDNPDDGSGNIIYPQDDTIDLGERVYKIRTVEQQAMFRAGKKRAGRRLDGREHNGFPAVRA